MRCRRGGVGCPIVSVILVALFLGAAGVANMMVICLLERRSEIGPRRTLRRRQRQQPLTSPPAPSCECPWLPLSQAARSPSRSIEPPVPAPPTQRPRELTRNAQPAKAHELRQRAAGRGKAPNWPFCVAWPRRTRHRQSAHSRQALENADYPVT